MSFKREEIIIVTLASLLLLGVFGAITLMDQSHGDVGAEYGIDQVTVSIDSAEGAIQVMSLPEEILIFGAGQQVGMDIKVTNMDPDTDIDTIFVTVPDSIMTGSGYEWYEAGIDHEWNMTKPQSDMMKYQAVDDFPGINFGGSAQYDTAGNEDDALDHDASRSISESLTVTTDFTAPSASGFKVGVDAIHVEIADLVTEIQNPRESMDPFPYPYIVAQDGDSFVVMILDTPSCDLEIVYDGTTYFGSSRASDIQTFQNGIKVNTDDGKTIVAVAHPGDGKIVKPIVRARTAGLSGEFTLSVFNFTISDITVGTAEKVPIVTGYTDAIPPDITTTVDNDIDGDGIYNKFDPDIDGDGQINAEDRDPYNRNVLEQPPTGLQASVDKPSVKEGEAFHLSAAASDQNGDPLTFTWTVDKVPAWSKTTQSLDVSANGEFKAGTYIFSVMVTDGRSLVKPTDTVTVTIEEKNESSNFIYIIAAVALVIIILIAAAFFYFKKKEDPSPTEEVFTPINDEPMEDTQTVQNEMPAVPSPILPPKDHNALPVVIAGPSSKSNDNCPTCGAALGPADTTCSACGTEFEVVLSCPICEAVVPTGSQTCPSCGLALDYGETNKA